MFQNEKEVLDLKTVSKMLGVSYGTINKIVKNGQLPSKRIGGVIRILKSDVIAFLEGEKNE